MEVVNLLKFLNNVSDLYTLSYAKCENELVNFLDLMVEDEQFTHSINLGLIFLKPKTIDRYEKYIIIDGLSRLLSLSLLLHAICECYKQTTSQNDNAIKTIRSKYLFCGKKLKLHLADKDDVIYTKIINGERLSGQEKKSPMFKLLHSFWAQIKNEKLQAATIFKMLQKINITIVETDHVSPRDLYLRLNKDKRYINQIDLIDDYLKENHVFEIWNEIKKTYTIEKNDMLNFLKDFFVTKFNFKTFSSERLYESFVNYFETMRQYLSAEIIMNKMKHSAMLYFQLINIDFKNENIRDALVNIKRHNGGDTYAYILTVYEDYYSGSISESIFIEILNTIDEYLKNRQNSGKNIDFNELILYLNALISYK